MLELDRSESVVCSYVVDANDVILAVDRGFHDFARDNGAPGLAHGVVGSLVWRFIADATSRHLYQMLFSRARETGKPLRIPYRCDSPGVLREMALEIMPGPRRSLQIVSRSLRVEAREHVALLDPMVARAGDILRMCSWCKAVLLDGGWLPLEEALAVTSLLAEDVVPPISHSVCPTCAAMVQDTLRAT